jgi:hypothetical protein
MENAKTIQRSQNQQGIEFTWSVWVYINSINASRYQNIFTKGNNDPDKNGLNTPNNAPGLYLASGTNDLYVTMSTFANATENITVPDIPLNNWVNIVLVCQNKVLDIYVNGVIAQSMTLTGVPKQNYGDVFIGLGGGFDGYVSNLWYWDHVLSLSEIQNLFQKGPNTVMISTQTDLKDSANRGNNYLALQWYTN